MNEIKLEKGLVKELNSYSNFMKAYIVEKSPNFWGLGDINAWGDFTGRRRVSLNIGGGIYYNKQILNDIITDYLR